MRGSQISFKIVEQLLTNSLNSLDDEQQRLNSKLSLVEQQCQALRKMVEQLIRDKQQKKVQQMNADVKEQVRQPEVVQEIKQPQPVTVNNGSPLQVSQNAATDQQYLRMIEAKIYQLTARLTHNERTLETTTELSGKRLSSLYGDVANLETQIRKNKNNFEMCLRKTQELQNQLLEFKSKKEAQLQKIINGTAKEPKENMNQSAVGGQEEVFRKMVMERVRVLSKDIANCVRMEDYQADREQTGQRLSKMAQDISQRITTETYDNLVYYMEKNMKMREQALGKPKETENDEPMLVLISNVRRTAEQLKMQLDKQSAKSQELLRQQRETSKRMDQGMEKVEKYSEEFQTFNDSLKIALEKMENAYEIRVGELEIKIDQLKQHQLKQDKIQKFMKEPTSASDLDGPSSINHMSTKEDIKKTEILKTQIQNQMAQHTKKLNKVYLTSTQNKAELQKMIDAIRTQVDTIKLEVDKKADHETVRKSFHFIENRIAQIVNVMVQNGQTEQEGDSLIAKKHWSCLSCDKNLDRYEGKLSDLRFTNNFPARFDSPRIGGYYRQNQNNQDYKKLFIGFSDKERKSIGELPQLRTDRSGISN